ncbi:hypothetical protein DFS33DRAFT_1278763 [Desarmillaria ectypa]|nr:hypothetical protein DFS33DRAFT_1278763 [Desarmillaria ectypa]
MLDDIKAEAWADGHLLCSMDGSADSSPFTPGSWSGGKWILSSVFPLTEQMVVVSPVAWQKCTCIYGAAQLGGEDIYLVDSVEIPGEQIVDWLNNYLAYNWMYEACETHMQGTDIVVYQSFNVDIPNLTLIK